LIRSLPQSEICCFPCRDATAPITIYHIGQPGEKEHWWDLCAGPHVESTGELVPEAVEIERLAGAYWRGDENRQMLTRVYGTAWQSALQLEAYHFRQEEALKRDHRKLGQQLSLFSIQVQLPHSICLSISSGIQIVITPIRISNTRRIDSVH
jgi:threonyl-tRNA synthetase